MIEIAYPRKGWYYYYATKEYAEANYPEVRAFQFETTLVTEERPGAKVFEHDIWVPVDKLLKTIKDAADGKPSYMPLKQAETIKDDVNQDD